MSGYLGSESSKATFSGSKAYEGNNVKDCVEIKGSWYWLTENSDQARKFIGKYSVHKLGWGNTYCDWSSFSKEEKELLKTTLK